MEWLLNWALEDDLLGPSKITRPARKTCPRLLDRSLSSPDAFPYSTMGDYFNAQTHFTQSVLKHGFLFCHIGKNCEVDSFRQTMLLNALNPDNVCLCKNPWSFPEVSTDS